MSEPTTTNWRQRAEEAEEALSGLLEAIDEGEVVPHPSDPRIERRAVYVGSLAVAEARSIYRRVNK